MTDTPTSLKRWSCGASKANQLPPVEQITEIHVYDFDNTLFNSPLPNRSIWTSATCGLLQGQDFLHAGGWWHAPNILASVGAGYDVERARAWDGCWNEVVVRMVRDSIAAPACLTVLLTGRKDAAFDQLLSDMCAAKKLPFDMLCLKPCAAPQQQQQQQQRFASTMQFKQSLLRSILLTYARATAIRLYEDRPAHVKAFRDFLQTVTRTRPTLLATVVPVADLAAHMQPTREVAEVQRMLNVHNAHAAAHPAARLTPYTLAPTVLHTAYAVTEPGSITALAALVGLPDQPALRPLPPHILITPRRAPPHILAKTGPLGTRLRWRATHVGSATMAGGGRVLAARVVPVNANAVVYTDARPAVLGLAVARGGREADVREVRVWIELPRARVVEFDTRVEEARRLGVVEESGGVGEAVGGAVEEAGGRVGGDQQQPQPQKQQQQGRGGNNQRGGRGKGRGAGGHAGGKGNYRGGGRGRGRGSYRSLDDVKGYGSGGMPY